MKRRTDAADGAQSTQTGRRTKWTWTRTTSERGRRTEKVSPASRRHRIWQRATRTRMLTRM